MTTIGLLGRKIGMTRVFTTEGKSIPVSVVEVYANRVSQLKNVDVDGYTAVQLVAGTKKTSRVNKAMAGHFAKAQVEAGDMLCEFRLDDIDQYTLGQSLTVADVFNEGQFVDVSAISKGKGFAGTVKRHNFRTQDATHGNSRSHRVPGSIGQNQTPGRVFKGKKMAGQMGNKRCTIQSLEVVKVDNERNLLLIKGAIPGAPGARVEVKPATKKQVRGQ
ncbi:MULTISPECIES: 50S ribosomal protein L3 [Legionella]|uniref:Large ribosomal subunit protein uL3 n=1 Tax=Legionella septentrionalis TaxID=2498109 RepID=A0A3S0WQL9_9GAMM|nr:MULTISPECIES: 50S ribosomal protein L3 [Legionella]MCP0913810.1 50S ribosomal protein L3 [Legionella sp. 27cVA30]RUQ81050.1 50S ribosomal protein L3 [Legionella septentrionalis]RUQ98658.1 50S ribosomal protein L3 [Legionella septentrionalis]RUR09970.1 50S ribosomal protein L3 [Legionella septentrionalis]RUR14951.1 50S ribosomal protein L3 [Legionella septentrionalis]